MSRDDRQETAASSSKATEISENDERIEKRSSQSESDIGSAVVACDAASEAASLMFILTRSCTRCSQSGSADGLEAVDCSKRRTQCFAIRAATASSLHRSSAASQTSMSLMTCARNRLQALQLLASQNLDRL